jgi:hypothetical protein
MVLWSPIWFVALLLAVGAPWFVRVLADGLELRARRRTQALVARVLVKDADHAPDEAPAGAVPIRGGAPEEQRAHEG